MKYKCIILVSDWFLLDHVVYSKPFTAVGQNFPYDISDQPKQPEPCICGSCENPQRYVQTL